jgi:hypothetical protein
MARSPNRSPNRSPVRSPKKFKNAYEGRADMKMDHLSANMDPLGSVDSGDRDKFI